MLRDINTSKRFIDYVLWRKRSIAAVMKILDRLYKESFLNISNTGIPLHANMTMACKSKFQKWPKKEHVSYKEQRNNSI